MSNGKAKSKAIIFGVGSFYEDRRINLNNEYNIIKFTDNNLNLWGTENNGIEIIPPNKIKDYEFDYIFIASSYDKEIKSQLIDMGIENNKIKSTNYYKSIIGENNPEVLISYVNTSFYVDLNKKITHGNNIESMIIRGVFNKLGYNFYSINHDTLFDDYNLCESYPRMVMGVEPNFPKLCNTYSKAIKIYYATGSYWEYQNCMIKKRTDEVNIKKNANIDYSRLVQPNKSAECADYIIQIGSNYTIQTYPEKLRKKIYLIRQSTFGYLNLDIGTKLTQYSKKDYMWFGSGGNILKGLDLVLEYFKNDSSVNLHIIGGPLENKFEKAYYEELYNTENIKYYGFIPISDSRILELANRCSFIIFPSCSEGMPGSVLNMMRLGLIPILSLSAAFDEIEKYGIVIHKLNVEGIGQAVRESKKIANSKEISKKFEKCYEFVKKNYNEKTFEEDFNRIISEIFKLNGIY
ncbi:glycosyltransferase [Clostridium saccharoperbutylacetonicum]|jgi:hypothetical protein